ncbi:MAG: transposase [Anaerolineae bacterium]
MRLTYKYRLKPTKTQQHQLEHMLELCRYVYNETLATRKNAYEQRRETLNYYATAKLLPLWKQAKPELKQVHSQVLQNVQGRVDLAFQAFFRRVKHGEQAGYPRFKGYGWYDSLTYPQYGNGVVLKERTLHLSKVGDVKVVLHRPIEGTIKTVTVRRSAGKWYACFNVEAETQHLPVSDNIVGVDLGLKTFAVLSNGEQVKRQRWMKQDAADVARLQRKKDKLPKGSQACRKVLRALNHAYQRATNRRTNFAHQESRKLVNRYGLIVFEDLQIQQMQANGSKIINRNIADVAWGQLIQYTTYKAENAGRGVVLINPRGTTQMCSGCGVIVPKDLSVRVHECPQCGLKIDRDLNAALNILRRGLASVGADTSVTHRSSQL